MRTTSSQRSRPDAPRDQKNRTLEKTRSRREFLGKVVKEMPFKVKAVQVDGGSEFKAECEARGIDLWILPPKSPKLNGCVERRVCLMILVSHC